MREIGIEEKKAIMLSMMDEIDSFCRGSGIPYFLVGGTLLGAIRHKGFIPWDDDIDIGVPREYYDRLLNEFVSTSGNVSIIDYRISKNYIWASAKAIDTRTVLIEQNNFKYPIGVFIDIFPFDHINGTYEDAIGKVKRNSLFKNILTIKHMRVSRNRSILKNIGVVLGKVFYIVPDRILIARINNNSKSNKSGDNAYICNFAGAWGVREISKASDFSSVIDAVFEGRKYMIPVGYDDYLRTVYGDYMTPPPKEKQVTHHDNVAYWRKVK